MNNEIIINASAGETRVAILERSTFSELLIERNAERNVMGNVVKGRVNRVLPGMQAAFVDIGLEKAAFLYAGDYQPAKANGDGGGPRSRRGGGGRMHAKIESVLSEGEEIVVQVAKEPIGTKGARITSHISIPGRHLVLTPWSRRVGVSRRIDSDRERRRLRDTIERLRPRDLGFIIRTAGDGVRDADLEADIRYLESVWDRIRKSEVGARAPQVLYSEPDLALRVIRDFASSDTKRIVIDSEDSFAALRGFVDEFVADPKPRIDHYTQSDPIFDHFNLERQIQANLERKVPLKSGGYLIIDQSEALTSIDVNTGRYVGKRDLEETVARTNLEAVKEIVHQLRFRNIGGIVIMDLIDMDNLGNREKVYRTLQEALRQDKARTNILKISELGLVEMTRKRTRENLVQTLCESCSYCEGRGYVLSRESVAFKVLREIRKDLPRFCGRQIAISVSPQVAEELLGTSREVLEELGRDLGREIEVRARPGLHREQYEVTALDEGEPISIALGWISESIEAPTPEPQAVSQPEPTHEVPETKKELPLTLDEESPEANGTSATESDIPGGAPALSADVEASSPAPDASQGSEALDSSEGDNNPPAEPAQTLDFAGESRILRPSEKDRDL
jgi:ribonuclease G